VRRPPHLSILSASIQDTITTFSADMRRTISDILEMSSGVSADFPKIRQYFQYLKQNDRRRKLTQPVKEAGFYVFDDDPVKEDHSLFFKFLSYPPQLLNQSRPRVFQHPRFRRSLGSFQAHFSCPNVLYVQHGTQDQYLQESGVQQ